MKLKLIKTEEDYQDAKATLNKLMDAQPGSQEEEELELLAFLIETYEKERFPIGLPDPVEAIKFRMEQQELTRKDMEKYIGSQSKVSEVLNRKRPLSLAMVRSLHEGLGISTEVLLQKTGNSDIDIEDEPFEGHVGEEYMAKTVEYYMSLPYTRELVPDAVVGWGIKIKELPGCMSQGKTQEEALRMIEDAMRGWLKIEIEDGKPIPEPTKDEEFSGKTVLRMSKWLHRRLAELAETEGVSLNQCLVTILAAGVNLTA